MQFLRYYWRTLVHSLTSIQFYLEILQQSFKATFIFFVVSFIWLGWIAAARFNLQTVPIIRQEITEVGTQIQSEFPQNLSLNWNGTQLQTSSPTPLEVPYPHSFDPKTYELPGLLGYITNTELTPANFQEQLPLASLFVVTPHTLYVNTLQGSWSNLPLSETPGFEQPFTITHDTVPMQTQIVSQFVLQLLSVISGLSYLAFPILLMIERLWLNLIQALFAYFLIRLNGFRISFKKTYQLGLHLMITAEIINQAVQTLYPHFQWSFLSLSYWLLFVLTLFALRRKVVTGPGV